MPQSDRTFLVLFWQNHYSQPNSNDMLFQDKKYLQTNRKGGEDSHRGSTGFYD